MQNIVALNGSAINVDVPLLYFFTGNNNQRVFYFVYVIKLVHTNVNACAITVTLRCYRAKQLLSQSTKFLKKQS